MFCMPYTLLFTRNEASIRPTLGYIIKLELSSKFKIYNAWIYNLALSQRK